MAEAPVWSLPTSIFAGRVKECEGRDFYDTEKVRGLRRAAGTDCYIMQEPCKLLSIVTARGACSVWVGWGGMGRHGGLAPAAACCWAVAALVSPLTHTHALVHPYARIIRFLPQTARSSCPLIPQVKPRCKQPTHWSLIT